MACLLVRSRASFRPAALVVRRLAAEATSESAAQQDADAERFRQKRNEFRESREQADRDEEAKRRRMEKVIGCGLGIVALGCIGIQLLDHDKYEQIQKLKDDVEEAVKGDPAVAYVATMEDGSSTPLVPAYIVLIGLASDTKEARSRLSAKMARSSLSESQVRFVHHAGDSSRSKVPGSE
eukprot:gnl/TRDRNA2_/TRDRNA2_28115_c0_seq1.p1 gnl/TRDRNA2_/TRDRNA2_28115_c0~~gnl/TRDRNA2_/TRDRNA2_28115_c0_seq1.p1  ORF type:complete len:192 (+),score=41.63 gnl/TRDRNA2_/TRDRNA2_28115_c0_seq1:37-576(+)